MEVVTTCRENGLVRMVLLLKPRVRQRKVAEAFVVDEVDQQPHWLLCMFRNAHPL